MRHQGLQLELKGMELRHDSRRLRRPGTTREEHACDQCRSTECWLLHWLVLGAFQVVLFGSTPSNDDGVDDPPADRTNGGAQSFRCPES
jgi:hypothetical protein